MKLKLLAAAGAALLLATAASAHAETFDWSFLDDNGGGLVEGTISGLNEGVNYVNSALSATVTMAGDSGTLGGGYEAYAYPTATNLEIDVSNGEVTFANMEFLRDETSGYNGGQTLFFGSDPSGLNGFDTYYPELNNIGFGLGGTDEASHDVGNVFVPSVSAAPEPSVWVLMFAGVTMIGGMLRFSRRRGASSLAT